MNFINNLGSMDRVQLIGYFMMLAALFLIVLEFLRSLKKHPDIRGDILEKNQRIYKGLDKVIDKIRPLKRVKEELQLRYGVINSSTENKNNTAAVKTIFFISILSLILVFGFAYLIKAWHLIIPVSMGIIIFPYVFLFSVLNIKLAKLRRQFPDAVNMFITKYTGDKNKDRALQRTYVELEYPIRYECMRLAQRMANKANVEESIKNFCRRVNYIWAEIFGELLIMNHYSVSDIGPELNEFSLLMMEEQAMEAHQRAELNSTKSVNALAAGFVFLAIGLNIAIFKSEAVKIYFESYLGILSISIAVLTVIVCLSLTFYFEKS